MTPDERDLLTRFLQDLTQTRPGYKDPDADAMISQALRGSPDAAYVLVQHAIMSDQALHAAQDQISQLQDQLRGATPQPTAGFLPGKSPWVQAPAPATAPDQYQAAPPPPSRGFFGPGPFNNSGGLGSFLRSAGTTAAGVAGGALLFDGISSLFGGHGGMGGGFGGFGGGFGGQPTEVVENNYYGDQGGGGGFGGDPGADWGSGGDDSGSFDT